MLDSAALNHEGLRYVVLGPDFMSKLDEYLRENSEVSMLKSSNYLKVLNKCIHGTGGQASQEQS